MKKTEPLRFSDHIALISAPWPLFSRPSIQLGTLKAYLGLVFPDMAVSCHHFYLTLAGEIGYPLYRALSNDTWRAESVYAALLYPERRESIGRFFAGGAKKTADLAGLNFAALCQRVQTATERMIRQIDWTALGLAGFSVCLCQLTASLYCIRRIRQLAPDLPLIVGGSAIGGDTAVDLLSVFPEIDLIVTGEGELPLARLVGRLRAGGRCQDLASTDGIVGRSDGRPRAASAFSQLDDLRALPPPDFSDYFDQLERLPADKHFFPMLPLEISRGCWWRAARPSDDGLPRPPGCAFCNLNLQWRGYRAKSVDQVVREVDGLTDRHRVLSVAFMDNALPPKKSRDIFAALGGLEKDFQLFGELRATTDRPTLEALRRAGLSEVQIGIESLSTALLRKLNKGTTAMDNLEVMKNCEVLGIKNTANLILHFPGSDATDVAETLYALRFARFFRPLRVIYFWLGRHSPVWEDPRAYGLTAVYNHPHYRRLFPEDVCRRTRFVIQEYRGDKTAQRQLWQPVARAAEKWRKDYEQLHAGLYAGPILTGHDGRSFLILRERRAGAEPVNHRLEGTSREIYLFCDGRRCFEDIRNRFAPMPADRLRSFLDLMVDKGLMFAENECYLSLAVTALRR